MNDLTFQKYIYYIDSHEKNDMVKDYLSNYDYVLNIEIKNTEKLFSSTVENNIEGNHSLFNDIFNKDNINLNNLNKECLTCGINNKKDTFYDRILEILSIKLFGDANFKSVLDNKNKDYFNKIFIDNIIMNINTYKTELFNYLNSKTIDNNINESNSIFNSLINNTNFIFPFMLSGQFLELEDDLKPLFESSNYGGSKIINGKYTIPLILEIKRS
jgi:hypothetical protein